VRYELNSYILFGTHLVFNVLKVNPVFGLKKTANCACEENRSTADSIIAVHVTYNIRGGGAIVEVRALLNSC
jgi:hypothetical protein